MVGIGPGSGGLPLDDGDLHMLYLDPHQQEVNFAHYDILRSINQMKHWKRGQAIDMF
jgi:hypothetical protein